MSIRTRTSWSIAATLLLMPGIGLPPLEPSAKAQQPVQTHVRRVAQEPILEEAPASPPLPLDTPVLGFLARTTPLELRPILGVPGASVFGTPVQLPEGTTRLHLAPGQGFALTEQEGASNLGLMRLNSTRRSEVTEISGALAQPVLVIFSPTGHSAALYSHDRGQVQVLTGLPDSPRVSRDLAASSLPSGRQLLAINDAGDALVLLDEVGHLYVSGPDNLLSLVYTGAEIAGAAFVPLRSDIVVCDRGLGNVYLIGDLRSTPVTSVLASNLDLPPGAVAIQPSRDGRSAFFASLGSNRLSFIDLVSSKLETLELPAPMDCLDQLKIPGTMLLSARQGEPGWVLETSSARPRVSFVPAVSGVGRPRDTRLPRPIGRGRGE